MDEIIDILAENPRTRIAFLNDIAIRKGFGLPIHPFVDQRYLYPLAQRIPPGASLPDGEGYLNMEDKDAGAPLLPGTKHVGPQGTGMGMAENADASQYTPVAQRNPFRPYAPKVEDRGVSDNTQGDTSKPSTHHNSVKGEPAGVALDVNGDMKANIPFELPWDPQAPLGMVREAPQIQPFPMDINSGPLSDAIFQRKRTIIRELKSLFQVILDGDVTMGKRKRRLHNPFHRTRIDNRVKLSENTSTEGAKREKISTTPPRQINKRIVLYRKLINDLNDLITLEISKNNKTNAFEGVEELAPAKLRRTIPKATPSKVVE